MNTASANIDAIRRPAFSFGFKLMVAMVLLIAGVGGTTMWILRGQIDRNYTEFLSKNFERQVTMFFDNQKEVLKNTQNVLQVVTTGNVRFYAALNPTDLKVDRLYSDLEYRLGELRQGQRQIIYRIFDAEGHYLAPPADYAPVKIPGISEGELADTFAPLVRAAEANPAALVNTVDYSVLGDPAQPLLYQVMILPIVDRFENSLVAYFVFGMQLDARASFGPGVDGQKNGFLLRDQRLISDSLPASLAQPLAQAINRRPEDANGVDFKISEDGGRYLLFSHRLHGNDRLPVSVMLFPLSELEQLTKEINWVIISIIPVSLLICLVLSAFVSRRFTRPILSLVQGAEAVGRGDFTTRVPVRSRDEVGLLSTAFNEMSAGLALKEKYRNVLDRVTDREIAARLLSGELSLGGELRTASVLFCDIRGFTPLTEGMDPVEVIQMLNLHMSALTTVVHRHHGVVDKFVGDALMAIFGAPKSYQADALDAVECALELLSEREQLNSLGGHVIQIGIGVATGQVVAGCTGSVERLNYTVLGDRVNLASRLCSRAPAGEIYIDENTRAALSDDLIKVEPVELSLMLKGFAQSIRVFRLRAANTTPPL